MLNKITSEKFDAFYDILTDSFPKNELRPKGNMQRTMKNEKYILLSYSEGDRIIGGTALWLLSDFVFIEYLAVDMAQRNKGLGAEILKELHGLYKLPLVLEAEPPDTEIARRRIGFYQRNGFFLNDYPYEQPAYSEKQAAVPLMIMTSEGYINPERFTEVKRAIYKEVYNKDIK